MASKPNGVDSASGSVSSWLAVMQGNGSREEKGKAHEQLEQFQKSVRLQV